MAQAFEDRVEEVLGLLHGMAWPLLEEAEKKKIVAKVARGVDQGDTIAAWSRALGVPSRTIGQRVERFRRSEPVDGAAPPNHNTIDRQVRGAKAVLRDEKLIDKLLEDRTAALALAKAAARHQDKVEQAEHAAQAKRTPGLTHRSRFNDVAGDLLRVRHLYGKTLNAARELDLDAGEADALAEDIEKIAQITGWFESWLDSGADDFDTELARILEA